MAGPTGGVARPEVHPLRVASIDRLTDDALALTFDVPDRLRAAYAFRPGQHLTLVGADGNRRSYSLCVAPSAGVWRIGVKQLPGGAFSQGVLPRLRVGDTLEVMTPSGSFGPEPSPGQAKRYVGIAAGSGITPVLSIASAVLETEPGSHLCLIVANRTHRSVMFLDEIAGLKDRFPDRVQVLHVLSREEQDVEVLSGRLDAARLLRLLPLIGDPQEVDDWFLCGPQQMVTALRDTLSASGAQSVHTELFHAEPVTRAAVQELHGTEDGAAQVSLRLEGRTTELGLRPDGPPILEAALAVRSDLPFACKGGVCGTCRAHLSAGTVEMDANWALEPEEIEAGFVLTCQAHPTSERVVLDYDA